MYKENQKFPIEIELFGEDERFNFYVILNNTTTFIKFNYVDQDNCYISLPAYHEYDEDLEEFCFNRYKKVVEAIKYHKSHPKKTIFQRLGLREQIEQKDFWDNEIFAKNYKR